MQKKAEAALKVPSKQTWDAYATDKVLLGARVSLDVQKTYDLLMESLPEDQQRGVRRNLKMTGDSLSLDIEKDVLGKLSGHLGVFFYGIAGNPFALLQAKNPAVMASKIGLMLVLKFKEPADVDNLLAKIVASTGGAVTVRPFTNVPEDESFKVLSLVPPGQAAAAAANPAAIGNFFIHGETVIFATTAFGDEAMHKYLTNARDDKKLGDVEGLDLGKEFAAAEGFNGLYFSSDRAQDNMGAAVAMGGLAQVLSAFEEASLKLDVDQHGGFALLTLDLEPKPAGAKSDDAKSDDQKPTDNKSE